LARELFAAQAQEYAQLQAQIDEVDARLMAWHRADECSRRLVKIPGVGPIGAVLLKMKTPEPELFRSGRQFAAWIGLLSPLPADCDCHAARIESTKGALAHRLY
jgi:transposase